MSKNKNELAEKIQRFVGAVVVLSLVVLIATATLWKTFFKYVDSDEMLIIVAKTGDPLPPDQILAKAGQKGIREDVYGEGRHFVMPYFYDYQIAKVVRIPPGQVGVVEAKVGDDPPEGAILVDTNQRGIWRKVLPPGKYRMNPHGYVITPKPAVTIRAGFVGFVKRKVGKQPQGEFADPAKDEQGIVKDVLPPGTYYLNPYEYDWREVEVGINQISFLGKEELARDVSRSSAASNGAGNEPSDKGQIQFPSADAFPITLDATIEWELLPENVARVMAHFGDKAAVEDKVIVPQSKSIGRTEGSKYGAKELLLGAGRERFQQTFHGELVRVGKEKAITINSAFIRHVDIPDELLKPIRDKKVADEKKLTAAFWEKTRKSGAQLETEKTLIDQRRQEVRSELQALVLETEADADKSIRQIDAETKVKVAEIEKQVATIESNSRRVLGEAEANVVKMRGEAEGKQGVRGEGRRLRRRCDGVLPLHLRQRPAAGLQGPADRDGARHDVDRPREDGGLLADERGARPARPPGPGRRGGRAAALSDSRDGR